MTTEAPELPPRNMESDKTQSETTSSVYSPLALLVHWETFQSDHQHIFKSFIKQQPEKGTNDTETISCVCQICHYWLRIERSALNSQCTGNGFPCHHFHSQGLHNYRCCGCGYTCVTQIMPPALSITTLKNLEATLPKTRSFADSAQQKEPTPTLASTCSTVLIYVHDLLNDSKRSINTENRAFLQRIGMNSTSQALLEEIGFQLNDGMFVPPEFEPGSSTQERLEQIHQELLLTLDLLRQQFGPTSVPPSMHDADMKIITTDMQTLLGIVPTLETRSDSNDDYINNAYASLGLSPNASDQLVSWTYQKLLEESTVLIDPYDAMDNLMVIANHKNSVTLQTLIAIERSKGKIGRNDIGDAYAYFSAQPDTPDDLLISIYQVKIADEPAEKNTHQDKLKIIAIVRHSVELIEFLKQEKGISFNSTENTMGLPAHMINSQRNVTTGWTGKFYRSSIIKSNIKQDKQISYATLHRPVGLNNIGNTCYFNSLLQYYYTILPFREAMINNEDYIEDENSERKTIGGIEVDQSEIRRAKKFVSLLRELFISLQRCQERAISPQYDLAYMALLNEKEEQPQDQDMTETKENQMKTEPDSNQTEGTLSLIGDEDMKEPVDTEMTDVNEKIPLSEDQDITIPLDAPPPYEKVVSEQDQLKHKPMDQKEPMEQKERPSVDIMMFGKQQDVTECMGNMMYLVEAALKPLKKTEDGEQVDDMIRQTFYGKARQILSYCDNTTLEIVKKEQEEDFSHIIVDAKEGKNLYDIMDEYFFANQVDFQGGHEATREVTVKSFPPILQILVQRVQFDRATANVYKSNAYIQFDKTIYLDRYVEENFESSKEKRTQVAVWRTELDSYTRQVKKYTHSDICNMPIPDLLEAARQVLEEFKMEASQELSEKEEQVNNALEILSQEAKQKRQLIVEGNQKIQELKSKIASQYKDYTKVAYNLHAVFIHQGQANYGHYWIYILDHAKNQWWKYNDSLVTKVNESEIFHDTTGSTANPYFLVYVDADKMKESVETIVTKQAEDA